MSHLSFYMVDVFAERPCSGNQLAVFPDAADLSHERMQQIAREINFSETTFIRSKNHAEGAYEVRIYTPGHEVPFAGHPTLGTAFIIKNYLAESPKGTVILKYRAGDIPVKVEVKDGQELYWMRQLEPEFRDTLPIESLTGVLGLSKDDFDERFPIEQVSTGLPHIIVPLRSLEALSRIKVSTARYYEMTDKTWAKNIQVFCPQTHHGGEGISTRMFADYLGIPEDPATGSGNGCLTGYLLKHGYRDYTASCASRMDSDAIALRSEQGYEMGRPSVLYLKGRKRGESLDIDVGGSVIPIARGEFF